MKLPYRAGMWFSLPLGDGLCASACIMRADHHVVDVAAFANDECVAALRVSDRALVLHRWRRIAAEGAAPELPVENARWIGAALAERIVARRCGVAVPEDAARYVRSLRNDTIESAIPGLPGDATIALSQRLSPANAALVTEWISRNPDASVRLAGEAVRHIDAVCAAGPAHLELAADPAEHLCDGAGVQSLSLAFSCDTERYAAAFPALCSLRIASRDARVQFAPLRSCSNLRVLQLSDVTVADPEDLAELRVTALAVSRVESAPEFSTIARLPLERLRVAHQPRARNAEVLTALNGLVELELEGLWQFSVEESAWIAAMPSLLRVEADLGGRRKNVEIYRRARFAYPWPW